jgi:hypothetical protein
MMKGSYELHGSIPGMAYSKIRTSVSEALLTLGGDVEGWLRIRIVSKTVK